MRFSDIKNSDRRSIVIDFSYGGKIVKVGLKVLKVYSDLLVATTTRLQSKSAGIEEPTDKIPEHNLRSMCELVAKCTYEAECENPNAPEDEQKWKCTDNLFFESTEEVIQYLDQDELLFLHEFYQNFRSITKKNEEFSAENAARISYVLGGGGDNESKANFFSALPRFVVFNYCVFTGSLLRSSLLPKSNAGSNVTLAPQENSPV